MTGAAAVAGVSAVAATDALAGTTSYKYDDLGRVIRVDNADGSQTIYTYDAADNRTQTTTAAPIHVTTVSNLRTLANAAGYAGGAGANYSFVVDSGVTIMGNAGGGKGIDTGTWPADAVLTLTISGTVYGGGGNGGAGSNSGAGAAGGSGGNAIFCSAPISIIVNSSGILQGPGGGGGGGGYTLSGSNTTGGDGGGGGFPNGTGGAGSSGNTLDAVKNGAAGTTSGGGLGGTGGGPAGGNGGGAGLPGIVGTSSTGAGGARGVTGYAIRKSGNTVNVVNNGTIVGPIA